MTKHIMQIVKVKLKPEAENILTKAAHDEVVSWLGNWDTNHNFKAVIADSFEAGLEVLKKELSESLVPWFLRNRNVRPEHFYFNISHQEITDDRFWMPSCARLCTDYEIPPKE